MFGDILLNALWHVITFIGLVYLVGYVISLINSLFYKVTGYSKFAIYATGFIGTPVHELSHLAMCLVFLHKINEVKFFQINDKDGVLGYVNHSWNPKNIYQQIGNYFIGIAPIVVGTLIIFLSIKEFLPATYKEISSYFEAIQILGTKLSIFDYVFDMFGGMFVAMFADISIGLIWWVFIFCSICISLHMNLSMQDIKGSLIAIPLLIGLILGVNIFIGLIFGGFYKKFLVFMNSVGGFLISVLILSLVLSAICLAIALIIKGVILVIKKILNR